jgi:hypothetical protein
MFKVGDKVKRIKDLAQDPSRGWPDFVEGAIYTVSRVGIGGFIALEGMGKKDNRLPYNGGCFELAKPEPQAAAIAGGLQEHRVGEYYPLAAVLYEHGDECIITIENLQTGEVSGFGDHAIDHNTFEDAYKHIEATSSGKETVAWVKGRVSYVHGRWVVAEPANPVRVTRLRNMLHRG